MPFNVPSLPDLRAQTRAGFAARLPGTDPTLARSNTRAAAEVTAAIAWLEYEYLGWQSRQYLPDTAETAWLERIGANYQINRLGPTPAAGNVILSGNVGAAVTVPLALQTLDTTVALTLQAAGTIGAGGTVTLPIEATTPGSAGNLLPNAALELVTAQPGINGQAAIDGNGLTGGTDAESDDSLRARILARVRQPPQGGSKNDYWTWAKAVPGVTRAWVYPGNRGPGTCDVTFVMDGRAPGSILPLPADIAAVQAALDAVRPVTADCQVFGLTALPVPVTVSTLIPNTAATQAAGLLGLTTLFAATTPPGASYGDGLLIAADGTVLSDGRVWLDDVVDAIKDSTGVTHLELATPTADVIPARGQLATLGAVTWPPLPTS